MTTIKFHCPKCGQLLEMDESWAGHQIACPHCSHSSLVPMSDLSGTIAQPPSPVATTDNKNQQQKLLEEGAKQAKEIFKDLKSISFKEEVVPIDHNNLQVLLTDFAFWSVTLLGILPLLIVTVEDSNAQLTLFALFFAGVWGVVFKRFILNDNLGMKWPIIALFFTGIVGIWLLLFVYRTFLPDFYLNLADSQNPIASLFGFIFQVGIWEECFKALPLLLFIKLQGKKPYDPRHLVTIGVFSGLGFAAFENLHYGENAIASTYSLTRDYGVEGLVSGVQNAMVVTMLRAVSLVFCHAVFSGIVAYFIATAMLRRERIGALIILGIGVAAVLHGMYDWFAGIQPTIGALLAGFSFTLFYGYLSKLRSMSELYFEQKMGD